MTSIAHQLTEALALLTEETWRKGNYFKFDSGRLCYCAHGAIQSVVNPEVRRRLTALQHIDGFLAAAVAATATAPCPAAAAATTADDEVEAALAAAATAATAAAAVAEARAVDLAADLAADAAAGLAPADAELCESDVVHSATRFITDKALLAIYDRRPDYVRKESSYDGKNYGKSDSSYLLGLFGLTASFNDDKKTTLSMIREKYLAAIAFAERNGL